MDRASVVFHYFGEDSYMRRLAQETVKVGLALNPNVYSKRVLLKHQMGLSPFEMDDDDIKGATVIDPTRDNFMDTLSQLVSDGYAVDVSILSHGYTNKFLCSKGTYGSDTFITNDQLLKLVPLKPPTSDGGLRMVWQCNCYGSSLSPVWAKLGAKAVMGTPAVNFFPTRYGKFIRQWVKGIPFREALSNSDTDLVHNTVGAFLVADAVLTASEWGGNLWSAATILGQNGASADYFSKQWIGAAYNPKISGMENMLASSRMRILGDKHLTVNM